MSRALYYKQDYLRYLKIEQFSGGLEKEPYRNDWRRDYARLTHSPSFRRLQGKTQLFPGVESDFFRNRLTHSLEVAQIAKSIAIRLNYNYSKNGKVRTSKNLKSELGISLDLVEFAGLAHDLGHPPFGHQGEEALDECMLNYGGFEGNAQTIRILTRIEKKFRTENFGFDLNGKDERVGLNLCYRTLASILKYDNIIPYTKKDRNEHLKSLGKKKLTPVKGYYKCDSEIVDEIKKNVISKKTSKKVKFKTIECYIMDIADDIAYSTYDLEDAFKAGFISPLDLIYPSPELLSSVCDKVNQSLLKENVSQTLSENSIVDLIRKYILDFEESDVTKNFSNKDKGDYFLDFANSNVSHQYRAAQLIAENGSIRTGFTSSIVGRFIRGVELKYNEENPALSIAKLNDETRILVEILKTFTYMSQITSPRLKIAEFRGKEIVTRIFSTLSNGNGYLLLPSDIQDIYNVAHKDYKMRIICDFVASMTDKYAIEFYGRLTSENPETIFKPF